MLYIIMTVVLIVLVVPKAISFGAYGKPTLADKLVGLFFGTILSLGISVCFIWALAQYPAQHPKVIKVQEIVALSNNTGNEGSFFLGCGTISETVYYFYMLKQPDGGLVMGKVEADSVVVYEDYKTVPSIVSYSSEFDSDVAKFWLWKGTTEYPDSIYIPKGSVMNNFNINLSK